MCNQVSHRGNAAISGKMVHEVKVFANRPVPQHLGVLDGDDGTKYFVVNRPEDDRRMTARRAQDFSDYYDKGKLPSSLQPDEHFYMNRVHDVTLANMVSAQKVTSRLSLAPWAQHAGDMYKGDKDGQLWELDCSCHPFSHSNNLCQCVVYIASQLRLVDISVLLDGAKARPTAGRPRKDKGWSDKGSVAGKERSLTQWVTYIRKNQAMRLHKAKVLVTVRRLGDEGTRLGTVENGETLN